MTSDEYQVVLLSGDGPPLVLVPGLQGRWEWMAPTVDALARSFRVATFSLCGEPGMPVLADFDAHLAQVDAAIDALGGSPVVLVGVSFGGWVAVRYAAAHPERVSALVLVSTPGPGYQLHPRYARWIGAPRRSLPAFVVTSPGRLGPEVRAALPSIPDRWRFLCRHVRRAVTAPMSASRAASRVRLALNVDFADSASKVQAPTLVVHGEEHLDLVVPPASTRRYADFIRTARVVRFERTGHIGTVTRPERFADIVCAFAGSTSS